MVTAQRTGTHTTTNVNPPPFTPVAAFIEGAYLVEILALELSEIWLHAVEAGVSKEHDLLTAAMGYGSQEHTAPPDSLRRSKDNARLEALDKGLAAAGE